MERGFPASEFGLYNLRESGATTAANHGVPDRLFTRHGHWRLEEAKDGYVEDLLKVSLSVNRSSGL